MKPHRMPESRSMASSTVIPLMRAATPCVFPAHPPEIFTETITPLSISKSIFREQTPRGVKEKFSILVLLDIVICITAYRRVAMISERKKCFEGEDVPRGYSERKNISAKIRIVFYGNKGDFFCRGVTCVCSGYKLGQKIAVLR